MTWLVVLLLLLIAHNIPLMAAGGALAALHAVLACALIGALRGARNEEHLWWQQQQEQDQYRDEEAWGPGAVTEAVSMSNRAGSATRTAVQDPFS